MQDLENMVPAPIGRVRIEGGFWGERQEVNRSVTLPSQYEQLRKTGRLDGLDPKHGEHHKFWDSDIAKWMEAAAYSLTTHPDAELEARLEEIVERFARLQCDDGYLNSWFTSTCPEKRWTNLRDDHELYCAGHLMEAAVAHCQATGKRHFVDMICRYADYIDSVFGRDGSQKRGYPGHEEIELALVKLHGATRRRHYLNLARYFIDERGRRPHYFDLEARARGEEAGQRAHDDRQAHLPVRQQDRATGHAVRAMYLYCGMADMARLDGDAELMQALQSLWHNVCLRQMYITGSVGSSSQGECFTTDFDLPDESSYCETCAAIGLVFWGHRMLNMFGEGTYGDVVERALYNGVRSGVSLSGDRYFYVNPLASSGGHHRQEWFGCACCPSNVSRLVASLGQYLYSGGDAVWVHLFASSRAELDVAGMKVKLIHKTEYPWRGMVRIEVRPEGDQEFPLNVRLPGWCRQVTLRLNGEELDPAAATRGGYIRLSRSWSPGDTVEMDMDMPPERVRAHPAVRMANGKVALQRGPLVYCLEEVDNPVTPLSRIALPSAATLECRHSGDLLGGVTVIESEAVALSANGWEDRLYSAAATESDPCRITAIPYYAWAERREGQMLVWLRRESV